MNDTPRDTAERFTIEELARIFVVPESLISRILPHHSAIAENEARCAAILLPSWCAACERADAALDALICRTDAEQNAGDRTAVEEARHGE